MPDVRPPSAVSIGTTGKDSRGIDAGDSQPAASPAALPRSTGSPRDQDAINSHSIHARRSCEESGPHEDHRLLPSGSQPTGSDYQPLREEVQEDRRIRRWVVIPEMANRALRVILLPDGETIHNAFFDRGFEP